jgi:hypothetical protein
LESTGQLKPGELWIAEMKAEEHVLLLLAFYAFARHVRHQSAEIPTKQVPFKRALWRERERDCVLEFGTGLSLRAP